jgi:hypothetical protein
VALVEAEAEELLTMTVRQPIIQTVVAVVVVVA